MKMAGNIFLVGMMGSGKTTVGKALARRLHRPFIDSDVEIERRTGVSIPVIFEIEGEPGFRLREVEAIAELTTQSGIVLATGGGAVIRAENRAALRSRGFVIYLCAPATELFARTSRDRSRPLLQTEDPLRRLTELWQIRDPLYREVADCVVDTNKQSVQALVLSIEQILASKGIV